MKGLFPRLLLLSQVLALCPFGVLAAQRGGDSENGAEVAAPDSGGRAAREPGADLYDAAVAELKKLHHPSHHRSRKPPGMLTTAFNFALKALPTLRLSSPPVEPPSSSRVQSISGPLLQAVKLLEDSSRQNNSEALYTLAQLNFYGNHSHPRDFKAAFDYYAKLALVHGNSSAQYMLGLLYSTGVGGAVEPDQARAQLYYTFAANQGHTRAEMTIAYRYHTGISTTKSCDVAVQYYKRVADKAIAWYRSGPPGGMAWISEAHRIADESGGVYGHGASVSSSGANAVKAHPNSDAYASIEDIIEYLDLMSQKGDFKASFNLGRIYYEGQRGLDRDFDLARRYFHTVTSKFWKKGGRITENFKPGLDKTASRAAGFIGRMFLRGEGVEQNFKQAKFWFDRGLQYSDAQSEYGLGMMMLHGYGSGSGSGSSGGGGGSGATSPDHNDNVAVPRNVARATELFRAAAEQDFSPAQVQLGALYLDQGHADDPLAANHYFGLAAQYGNLEAYYYLAEMNLHGVGRERSCATAASLYKNVAERAEPLVSSWAEANAAYEDGDEELALLEYLGAAEQGYEKAQNNVAYMLDRQHSWLRSKLGQLALSASSEHGQASLPLGLGWCAGLLLPEQRAGGAGDGSATSALLLLQNPSLALVYWTRSARQGNIDSLVKMGDCYLGGLGTQPDVDKAVQCYQGASEYHQSAQALYNLGWMHENGVGLNQDYHLAKRYYDSALETNEEAYLPVALSLIKLRVRSAWNTFTHGRINSIQDEPASQKERSLSEWIANFLQDDYYEDENGVLYEDMYEDGEGGVGGAGLPGDDDPLSGGGGELDDVDLFDSLAVVGLAALLVGLIIYRQQRQQRRRAEQEAAAAAVAAAAAAVAEAERRGRDLGAAVAAAAAAGVGGIAGQQQQQQQQRQPGMPPGAPG